MARPTIILDGLWGRPRRFEPLRRAIASSIGPAEIFPYDSGGRAVVQTSAAKLAAQVAAMGTAVNLVGYSMGGLVVCAAVLLEPTLSVARVVFLNTPHHGSLAAWLLNWPGVRQMRPGSELLRQLHAAPWTIPSLTVWTRGDLMVLPNRNARWPELGREYRCRLPAHVGPIYSRAVRRRVVAFLADDGDSPNGDAEPRGVAESCAKARTGDNTEPSG